MPLRQTTGWVKFYKPTEGYGFVTEDGSNKDIFLHRRCVEEIGRTTLEQHERVVVVVKDRVHKKPTVKRIVAYQ